MEITGPIRFQKGGTNLTLIQLYVYPIKALRGISLRTAELTPQGIVHDRRFMLYSANDDGSLKQRLQVATHGECTQFEQALEQDGEEEFVVVRQLRDNSNNPIDSGKDDALRVPLNPDISNLETAEIDMHGSATTAYRMGSPYEDWFSDRLGYKTTLLYIGDGKRPILGTIAPSSRSDAQKGIINSIASYLGRTVSTATPEQEKEWLTFSDVAPYLITSESSLADVSSRLGSQTMEMRKFRPNIVVSGEGPWDEDFWGTLAINGRPAFELTGNCARCSSINVDYETGKLAPGELGTVLKKLMKDRRVDEGSKWEPIFGRLGFLVPGEEGMQLGVGAEVGVIRRIKKRDVWDWPSKSELLAAARKDGQ